MTDEERIAMEKRLYTNDDAMVWAKEFVALFDGYEIAIDPTERFKDVINESTMVGWFSNAMETAIFFQRMRDRGNLAQNHRHHCGLYGADCVDKVDGA